MAAQDANTNASSPRKHPGAEIWGDPACRECRYTWSTSYDEALRLIAAAGERYRDLIAGRERQAMRKPDDKTWSAAGYIWHTGDWFRIQGQRIYALANDPLYRFVPLGVEQDELGEIFNYDELPPVAGLWALEWAAELFVTAARHADPTLVFRDPAGNEWTVHELVVWVAHEAVHHESDIRRGLNISGDDQAPR